MTGGCGFIGRALTDELLAQGYEVRILDALIEQVHGEGRPPLPHGVELVEGDVRDRQAGTTVLVDEAAAGRLVHTEHFRSEISRPGWPHI